MTEVTGIKELQQKINEMEKAVGKKIVRQSLQAALKPMLNAARANAPRGKKEHFTQKKGRKNRLVAPGFLKRNIKLKSLKRRDKGRVAYGIWATGEAWYGQLIETGWSAGSRSKEIKRASRKTKGGLNTKRLGSLGDKRNRVQGKPWLGPAYAQHKDAVTATFMNEIGNRLRKAMKT